MQCWVSPGESGCEKLLMWWSLLDGRLAPVSCDTGSQGIVGGEDGEMINLVQ